MFRYMSRVVYLDVEEDQISSFPGAFTQPTTIDECSSYSTFLSPGAVTCIIDLNHSDR